MPRPPNPTPKPPSVWPSAIQQIIDCPIAPKPEASEPSSSGDAVVPSPSSSGTSASTPVYNRR